MAQASVGQIPPAARYPRYDIAGFLNGTHHGESPRQAAVGLAWSHLQSASASCPKVRAGAAQGIWEHLPSAEGAWPCCW